MIDPQLLDILVCPENQTRLHIADEAMLKRRVGADAQYLSGPFLFRGEATFGQNESDNVVGALFEADYTVPTLQSFTVKAQGRFWTDDPGESASTVAMVALGGSYDLTSSWALRAGVFHDLEKPGNNEDTAVFIQVYYFGS